MMNEFIEIRLINVSTSGVILRDTSNRIYRVPVKGQLRIGLENLKAILDNPTSKRMICQGLIKVDGLTDVMLRGCILTDEEIDYLLGERIAAVEEDTGISQVKIEEEKAEVPIVKAITFYNWIKNDKEEKIREALQNPVNYDTVKDIVAKNERYNTDLVKKLLAEVED